MADEVDFESGSISNLDLDLGSGHMIMTYRRGALIETSTFKPNFIRIGKTFCGRTDRHFSQANLAGLCCSSHSEILSTQLSFAMLARPVEEFFHRARHLVLHFFQCFCIFCDLYDSKVVCLA